MQARQLLEASLSRIWSSNIPHIKTALDVIGDSMNKYSVDSLCFSMNGGKDNAVTMYLIAAFLHSQGSQFVGNFLNLRT